MNVLFPAVLALLFAAEPQSVPVVSASQALHHPRWVRRPDGADYTRAYPYSALTRGTPGHSEMECGVKSDGMLGQCKVLSETPPGMGFGDAELQLARRFQIADPDGITPGVKVRIPVSWKVE
jgi:hypothetical protein